MERPTARAVPTERELRMDIVLGVLLFVAALISTTLSSISSLWGEQQAPLYTGLLYAAVIGLSLAVRRRYPVTVAVICCAAYFLAMTLYVPEIYVGNVAMFISLYTVGAWVNDRIRAVWSRALIILGMFIWLLVNMFTSATQQAPEDMTGPGLMTPFVAFSLLQFLINVMFFGGAYYMGDRAYASALDRLALEEQRLALVREQERSSAQAVALDRVQIARELHDVVAHHVSAMGVQAAAAKAVYAVDPAKAVPALDGIQQSARQAIDELHHLLETLRAPGDSPAPVEAPSTLRLDGLPALVETVNGFGVPTTLTVVGDAYDVPEIAQVNLYRIAQEALTNARRHGGPHVTADVRLRYADDAVELEVANTGRISLGAPSGLGQLGMRERAAASGGSVEIGPRPRGGYLVRATVPRAMVDA